MNIDLNQVFHLHNSVDRPITVVYKKLHLQNISEVNAVLKIDETDHVTEQRLLMARILTKSTTCQQMSLLWTLLG